MFEFHDSGIQFLREQRRALLGDDAGLGKTRQLLLAAVGKTLVIAPAMILDGGVWESEHQKWNPDLNLTSVSYSSICQRVKTPKGGTSVLPQLKPEYATQWDTVICDESHYLKGRKTLWTKAIMSIKTDRLYLATGTPIPNWAHELWAQLNMLYPKDTRFTSYWRWVAKWFHVERNYFSGNPNAQVIGDFLDDSPQGLQRFYSENLGSKYLARKRDDVLTELPPLTQQHVYLDMKPKQRKAYCEIKKDYITWLEDSTTDNEIVAWNTAAQFVKLAKLSTGLELFGSKGSVKLDYLTEVLKNRSNPVLVVAHFRDTLRAIEQICDQLGVKHSKLDGGTNKTDRTKIVKQFQSGGTDVLIGSISVIAEGLTLTSADTIILVEHSTRPSKNEQVIRRIHRIGQTKPVQAIHLWSTDTVDTGIKMLLETKTEHQMKALSKGELKSIVVGRV